MAINTDTSSSIVNSGSEAPGHCHDLIVKVENNKTNKPVICINWKDSFEGVWGGTAVLLKKNKAPRNESDGNIIADTNIKHQHFQDALRYELKSTDTSGDYYITLFPYSVSGIINTMKVSTAFVTVIKTIE